MNGFSFTAKAAYASKEEGCYMVGFADSKDETEKYIILQKAFEFDEQDIQSGMDGEYIEINSPDNSGYKCCRQAALADNSFVIELNDGDSDDVFRIEAIFDGMSITDELKNLLGEILGAKLVINRQAG